MVECPMCKAAAAVILHYYGQVTNDNGTSTIRDMIESDDQEWLLKTNQGWAMWSTRSAHWRYRCEVKAGASPVFASYFTTWLRELCEWVGFYTGERREQCKGFQKSLEQLRDTRVQPRQGVVQVHGGLNAWWQTHTGCFTQEKSADNHSWQRATESRPKRPKRPRQAGPGVLQGVQELIAELVEKGYRIVYTNGSSKRLCHKDMRRAGGFGVFAAEDEQGPEVRFCGYVPTHYRQTNNGADLWETWKLYRDSGCQNWQSSPTRNTCSWERLAGPNTGSQRDGQPHLENCKFTSQSAKCCSRKWRHRGDMLGGNMSQHMSTCREMRWRMDWPWKACVQAHCGHSMLHQNHYLGQSPR